MNQTEFFEWLGAPLVNSRWSWGAVRKADGAVILRVWEDRMRIHSGLQFAQLTFNARFRDSPVHGHRERLQQVARIRHGAPCLMVLCEAADTTARPRRIADFDGTQLFPGGELIETDGEWWIEVLPGIPIDDARVVAGQPA